MCQLLWVVCGIAVEPGEDTTADPIRELNHNAMLICFCEPPLKDQPDYRMVELLPAVCNNIRWGGNPICLLIIIRKAIRQLE